MDDWVQRVYLSRKDVEKIRDQWPGGPPYNRLRPVSVTFNWNGDLVDVLTTMSEQHLQASGFINGIVGSAEEYLKTLAVNQ